MKSVLLFNFGSQLYCIHRKTNKTPTQNLQSNPLICNLVPQTTSNLQNFNIIAYTTEILDK